MISNVTNMDSSSEIYKKKTMTEYTRKVKVISMNEYGAIKRSKDLQARYMKMSREERDDYKIYLEDMVQENREKTMSENDSSVNGGCVMINPTPRYFMVNVNEEVKDRAKNGDTVEIPLIWSPNALGSGYQKIRDIVAGDIIVQYSCKGMKRFVIGRVSSNPAPSQRPSASDARHMIDGYSVRVELINTIVVDASLEEDIDRSRRYLGCRTR